MENLLHLSNHELEALPLSQKQNYYHQLKDYCEDLKEQRKSIRAKKLIKEICPFLRSFPYELRGVENIPESDEAIFVCNHSNSHDIFLAHEVLENLGRKASVMVATDCLSLVHKTAFYLADATFIDRRSKESSVNGVYELASKMLEGQCGVIFGEATWNLHPILPMQAIKIGGAKIGAITEKVVIPTIFEYVEIPEIHSKESHLYKKCIVYFGHPLKIDQTKSLVAQSLLIEKSMIKIRRELWEELNIKRDKLSDINPPLYLNHTYLKKFKAFGFTYDSEKEAKFLFSPNNQNVVNEYHLDENNNFVPGITLKKK